MSAGFGRLAAAIVLLGFASGCGASTPADESTSTSASASATADAADGTDLSACEDGTCEVRIDEPSSIELDGGLMVELLEVESIDETTVALRLEGVPDEGMSGGCVSAGGSCDMSSVGSSAQASVSPGAILTVNELAIGVVAISDGSAVLRLSPVDR